MCGGEMLRKERETAENARKKGETAKKLREEGETIVKTRENSEGRKMSFKKVIDRIF